MELRFQEIPGYAFGAQQPSILLKFKATSKAKTGLENALDDIIQTLNHPIEPDILEFLDHTIPIPNDVRLCVSAILAFNSYVGDIRLTKVKVFKHSDEIVCAVPTLSLALTKHSLAVLNHIFQTKITKTSESFSLIKQQLLKAKNHLPSGTNAKYFLKAAGELRIPFHILDRRHIIYGYGAGSSIFNSSITERDSSIGVSISKSKVLANRFLQKCGFPVADQKIVTTVQEAIDFASSVGYPVVIKPEREDQGRGVYPNLQNENQLITSFKRCSAKFKQIIAEKHIHGDMYRINMFSGNISQLHRKKFAYVRGDGSKTIEELIQIENTRRLSIVSCVTVHPIKLDQLTIDVLSQQGYTPFDRPKAGEKVYTSFLPHSYYGSLSEDARYKICTENLELLSDVSKTLALGCVGFDFISKDISIPWFENGAVICEVNAQPQITPDIGQFHSKLICDRTHAISIKLEVVQKVSTRLGSLFNKGQDKIELEVAVEDLIQFGSPVQYYDEIKFQDEISKEKKDYVLQMLSSIKPLYRDNIEL
jgi:D-alanine-D-alanine ligase-like ATP-grasp enzyme